MRTRGDVVLVATTQEELGLRGMDWWLAHNPRPDMVVAVDGGLGPVSYGALGIYWTRYHFTGEGSHTNTSAGKPTRRAPMADAIRSIYELRMPDGQGGAVYNVGMVGGGKVFNAIPQDVWFTVDLRSVNPALLDSLDAEIGQRVRAAAEANHVETSAEQVQHQRAAGTADMLRDRRAHPIVQTALDVHAFLGIPARGRGHGEHRREHGGHPRHPRHLGGPRPRRRPAHAERVGRPRQRPARHADAPAAGREPGRAAVSGGRGYRGVRRPRQRRPARRWRGKLPFAARNADSSHRDMAERVVAGEIGAAPGA